MELIPDIRGEPAFPPEEYEVRRARLRAEMRRDGLDVLLVHQPPRVFYFSGYENLHVYDLECVAFSETVMVIDTGCESLTRTDRRLVEV